MLIQFGLCKQTLQVHHINKYFRKRTNRYEYCSNECVLNIECNHDIAVLLIPVNSKDKSADIWSTQLQQATASRTIEFEDN